MKVVSVLRIVFFKCSIWGAQILGRGIKYIQKNKTISLKNIHTIIINRKDRIGDAVITKPLIYILYLYLKQHGYKIQIQVIASEYNASIFSDLPKDIQIITQKNTFAEYAPHIGFVIRRTFGFFVQGIRKRKELQKQAYKDTVFLNFVGGPADILMHATPNMFVAGENLFFNNFLTDFSLSHSYVGGAHTQLMWSYIHLIEQVFSLSDFSDFVTKHIEQFASHIHTETKKQGILIFIWNKAFRNLPISVWIDMIGEIHHQFPHEKICVIDDHTNEYYAILKDTPEFLYTNALKENTFSLEELRQFAAWFRLLIGVDGGGFNFIRNTTNSVTIYTLGSYVVWSLFTGKAYIPEKISNSYYIHTSSLQDNLHMVVQKNHPLLPSLDYGLWDDFFSDFPVKLFVERIMLKMKG